MSGWTRTVPRSPDGGGSGGSSQDKNAASPTSKWEWAVAALGLALVVGGIGYMAHHALTTDAKVLEVTVERVSTHATQGGYVVTFAARNHGNATAASLRVEGELRRGPSVMETSGATVDYLPSFSERWGGLFFREDPDRHELRLFPKGYAQP